jgi:hypothetical protein
MLVFFAVKSPPPLRNRDFVTQRSWLDMGKEKWIINHSVNHEVGLLMPSFLKKGRKCFVFFMSFSPYHP